MRLYVDTADADAITKAQATGYIFGVTTNPTLLRRAGRRRPDLVPLGRTAVAVGLREIHLQVFADDADGMVTDAKVLHALDPGHVVVKIPATPAGFRAARVLAQEGMPITVTAVYAVRQVVLTGIVGAQDAAVYLGRLRDAGQDAAAILQQMLSAIHAQQLNVRVLVASVRTVEDLEMLAQLGVPAATLPPAILFTLPDAPGTAEAVQGFRNDIAHL
jgi:transaldolase